MYEKVTEIVGKNPGSTSIIFAGVHGNEKCGVEAFANILPKIKIDSGKVIFCYGNPRAIEENKRFTESNLNRMFKKDEDLSSTNKNSYEYKRAQFLKTYLNQADVLLDIHASSNTKSKPFIICEANAKGIIEYLPADLIVSGFDAVEPGGTDYYMNSIGKIGICIECGAIGDPIAKTIAEQSIFAFLKARGHIKNDLPENKQSYINMYELYMTKTDNFITAKDFADFEEVSKNQIIGTDGGEEIVAKKDSIILFAHSLKKSGLEAFLLGEKI